MRQNTPSPLALGRQLAEWRQPLDQAPDVEEAVARMLHALESHQQRGQQNDYRRDEGNFDFNRAAAD
jgi:hypothetical protein